MRMCAYLSLTRCLTERHHNLDLSALRADLCHPWGAILLSTSTTTIGPAGNNKIFRARNHRYLRKFLTIRTRRVDAHDGAETRCRSGWIQRRADLSRQDHEIAIRLKARRHCPF